MRTTFALIQKYGDASKVVDTLIDKTFSKESINIIAQKTAVEGNRTTNERMIGVEVTTGIESLETMLGRQKPIQTGSAGDLYAAGEVAKIIVKTAAIPGAVDSGLEGALADFGVGEAVAQTLAKGVRGGELLIAVRTEDERAAEVVSLLNQGKARQVATISG